MELMHAGADPNFKDAQGGCHRTCGREIAGGYDFHSPADNIPKGFNSLHLAAQFGHSNLIAYLIAKGMVRVGGGGGGGGTGEGGRERWV